MDNARTWKPPDAECVSGSPKGHRGVRKPGKTRRAFTLVEVLLVIGIVAALSVLVFAAFTPARLRARQAVCASNMHQWGQAFAMYIADYDGIDPARGLPLWH
ncbi:MAG TPA: type II secretion system protein, partial [Chthonomonadales bacterium]|nr:type II secretion system protein [Chthonomonadales bacterium]